MEEFKGMFLELDYGKDIKLDLKDKKIIVALAQNARISITNLSKIVGLSKDTIIYRINRLKKLDLLRHYVTFFNPFAALNPYTLVLRLENIEEKKERELISFFAKHPFIIWVGECSGEFDFVIELLALDTKHLDTLLKEIKSKCSNYLKNYEILPILSVFRYETFPNSFSRETGLKLNFDKRDFSFGRYFSYKKLSIGDKKYDVDKTDASIIKILASNCNLNIATIAKRIKISPDAAKYRIIRMINRNIILGFKAIFNVSYLHYHGYISFFSLYPDIKQEQRNLFERYFVYHEDIPFALETSGKFDYQIYLFAKDPFHFNKVLKGIRNKFSDIIERQISMLILKDYKLSFFPEGLLNLKR